MLSYVLQECSCSWSLLIVNSKHLAYDFNKEGHLGARVAFIAHVSPHPALKRNQLDAVIYFWQSPLLFHPWIKVLLEALSYGAEGILTLSWPVIRSFEDQFASDDFGEHNSQSKDIYSLVILFVSSKDFWCAIYWWHDLPGLVLHSRRPKLFHLGRVPSQCLAEVRQDQMPLSRTKNVVRFDIAVDDVL